MRNAVETAVVLLLLLLITLSGCGKSDVEAYREASTADTVNAYEDFLRKHGDSEFRAEATNRIRELRTIESYYQDLKPEDPMKRMTAAYKLGLMGKAAMKSVPILIPLLADNTPCVWSPHMEGTASSRRKGDGSVETTFFFSSSKDSGWDGRLSSLIGAPSGSTIPETKTPAGIACDALKKITGEDFGTSKEMWQSWWDNRQKAD